MSYYSVSFDNMNTWDDWRLIPTSPPMVAPPACYTNYVEIPGRASGPIDLSEALTGQPSYNNSEGEWEFTSHPDYGSVMFSRQSLYDDIRHYLHNRTRKVSFDDDPQHYYIGRFEVAVPKTGKNGTSITIKYKIKPVRYLNDGTVDEEYP